MKNTKEIIFNATLDLLEKKSLENIQVIEICEKAHISRTTFYNHYKRVDEIIIDHYKQAHAKAFSNRK